MNVMVYLKIRKTLGSVYTRRRNPSNSVYRGKIKENRNECYGVLKN